MTELEKLYNLRDKAEYRKQAAKNNIDIANNQIIVIERSISQYKGELSSAEYFLEYINQYIADLEKMSETANNEE